MTAPGPSNNSRTYGDGSVATNSVDTINVYPGRWGRLPLLFVLAVLAFLLALGDLAWCLWKRPGGGWGPYTGFLVFAGAALLAAVGAIAGSVPVEGRVGRLGAKLVVWLAAGSLVFTTGSMFTFRYTVDHRDIPVGVVIEGQQPLGGGGNRVLLLVVPQQSPDDRRERLRLTFDLGEDDAAGPACAHKSRVVVTAMTSGVEPHEAAGLPAKARADFHVGKGWDSGLRFQYELRDAEPGCLVRLQKVSGTLHD